MNNIINSIIEEINNFHAGDRKIQPRLYIGSIQWDVIRK